MSQSERDVQYREIITKAVCGKGRKFTQATHTLTPTNAPSSILGCWIINHHYKGTKVGDVVEISGSYDINVWYSHNQNTRTSVAKETVSYVDQVPLTLTDKNILEQELDTVAKAIQQPTACEATISNSGSSVYVQVEREFLAEVIGETKVCVLVDPDGCDDFEEKDFSLSEEFDQNYEDLDPDILIDDLD